MRIGHGYDVHRLVEGRDLIIGGVKIDHHLGLLGHSDADVLTHAVMDAIIGALALRDIGYHFPDNEDSFKDIDSLLLLERVSELLKQRGYTIGNIDATIIAQKPKLSPFIEVMRENIARVLNTSVNNINVKATTEEKLGFTGSEEGISAHCVCILTKDN
ncbi:MAG: 2-C-methyl-D-erythritol 2,4-cyclodiphosphate synthase [Clostridium sp.]|uniref:2-C-methyl-D-erythritol 2,4-cyclodiphosphate synthase n=1 Tax=Clostridium sp. TaxID=1506 RepID=UPI002FC88410